ncbi:MAG: GNAT family N-acetyltransferase [Microthrixaceae bacterium]
MAVAYITSASGLTADQLVGGFFEGWATPLTADEHLELLHAATHVVLAIEDGQVVGFVNALSDGVLSAYIPLLEVLPPWRGQGIGNELVRQLLTEMGRLYMIDVMCDAEVFPFYERLGFQQASGGVLRHYDWRTRPDRIP